MTTLYINIYIVIKAKTNNIFKVIIFRLLHLSNHDISLYKFHLKAHIRFNSYRARYEVVQGTSRTRFNFYNKDTNNNNNLKIRVKLINNSSIMIIITITVLLQITILTIKLIATVITQKQQHQRQYRPTKQNTLFRNQNP